MTTHPHLNLQHSIRVPVAATRCLDFFTPKGEMDWMPDWHPTFLDPADGTSGAGLTFLSQRDGLTTYWIMVDYDPGRGLARYARITPSVSSVLLTVECVPDCDAASIVTIIYRLVPLGPDDDGAVKRFADGFVAMIEGWRKLLIEHLQRAESVAPTATA